MAHTDGCSRLGLRHTNHTIYTAMYTAQACDTAHHGARRIAEGRPRRARKEGQTEKNQLASRNLNFPRKAHPVGLRGTWSVSCVELAAKAIGQGPLALLFSANSLTSHDWPDDASRRFGCGSASPPPPPAS